MFESKKILFVVFLTLLAVHMGCAGKSIPEAVLIYPPAPEEPRIFHVKNYTGEADYQRNRALDLVFGPKASSLGQMYGVAARGSKVYAAVFSPPYIAVFDEKEQKFGLIGTDGPGRFISTGGIALAADGTIYTTDPSDSKIRVFSALGQFMQTLGSKGQLSAPAGVAVNDELSRLYVVDRILNAVLVYSLKGEFLFQFGGFGDKIGQFNAPTNVAIDRRNGTVFVVDTMNFRVQVFDKDGKYLRKFGEIGDSWGQFTRPKGIGIDSEGHAYVVDSVFGNVQIFDDEGRLLLYFGNFGKGPGELSTPTGLYIDEADRIFVGDSGNGRVQQFQYLSEKWKRDHPAEYKQVMDRQIAAQKKPGGEPAAKGPKKGAESTP